MSPTVTKQYLPQRFAMHAECFRDLCEREACVMESPGLFDGGLGQLGAAMPFAYPPRPVPDHVGVILLWRRPIDISTGIVEPVPVTVGGLMPWCRRVAVKDRCDQAVDPPKTRTFTRIDADVEIPIGEQAWLQRPRWKTISSRSDDGTVAAREVAGSVRDRAGFHA